jgi:hypothetical protein
MSVQAPRADASAGIRIDGVAVAPFPWRGAFDQRRVEQASSCLRRTLIAFSICCRKASAVRRGSSPVLEYWDQAAAQAPSSEQPERQERVALQLELRDRQQAIRVAGGDRR